MKGWSSIGVPLEFQIFCLHPWTADPTTARPSAFLIDVVAKNSGFVEFQISQKSF
jgi:hypothetical protein